MGAKSRVSDISEEVFDFIDEMSQLSFVRRANLSSEGMIVAGNDFLWSVDLLNQAITYVDEYVAFMKRSTSSLSLQRLVQILVAQILFDPGDSTSSIAESSCRNGQDCEN